MEETNEIHETKMREIVEKLVSIEKEMQKEKDENGFKWKTEHLAQLNVQAAIVQISEYLQKNNDE